MPSLDSLVSADPGLRYAARDMPTGRIVAGVWPAGSPDRDAPARGWKHILAVMPQPFPPESDGTSEKAVEVLARSGASGVVAEGAAPAYLLAAARRCGLPVLIFDGDHPLAHLAQLVADARCGQEAAAARRLHALLACVPALSADSATAQGVLRWLGRAVGGQAVLIPPHQPAPLLSDGAQLPAHRVADLAAGHAQSAADTAGSWSVRMYALGPTGPHSVLAVARQGDWSAAAAEAVARAESILSGWLRLRSNSQRTYTAIRASLLQMLMSGQILAAQRSAHPLAISPDVLTADQVKVHVMDSAGGGRRELLASVCEHHLGPEGLVTYCPVDDGQLIIVTCARGDADAVLRGIIAEHPGHHVGTSRSVPLDNVADGHDQATRALAAASASLDRCAEYDPETDLAQILPTAPAHCWAADLLSPLGAWSPGQRGQWLDTMRLWLVYGPGGASRITGLHRNTPRLRVEAVAGALALNLASLADRVRIDLALRIDRLYPDASAPAGPVPSLIGLLRCDQAHHWAEDFLARVDGDLLDTVTTWIESGRRTDLTAARLGVHAKTVQSRLRHAEGQLRRPLISPPDPETAADSANGLSGAHDLVLAAHITGILRAWAS
jgi:PucR C-terminal helix-turn-helix domain